MEKQSDKSRIKELRENYSISQVEMADELGVSQQSISRIENYPEKMPVDLLISISRKYEVSTDYLLGLTNTKTVNRVTDSKEIEPSLDYFRLLYENMVMINTMIQVLLLQQSKNDLK